MPVARPTATAALGAAIAVAAVAVALVAALAPGAADATQLPWLVQGAALLAAAVSCGTVAARAGAASRWFWSLIAAWTGLYGAVALTFGTGELAGWSAPGDGALDVLWVPSYVPLIAALVVLYRELVGRWAWGGLVESLAVACAAGLFVWERLVAPVGTPAAGLLGDAAGLAAFAAMDLLCLCLVTWLMLRTGARPRWTVALLGALVAQGGSDVLYLRAAALGEEGSEWASSCLGIVTAACVTAMAARRRAGERARGQADAVTAPFWHQLVPLPVCFAAGVTAVLRPGERHLGLLALLALVGVMARLVVLARRADDLARENARLARTDPLTGAENRRVLDEELGRALALARRTGAPVALIAIDLDGFKAVNDRLGHHAGDRLLVAAADAMRGRLRGEDRLLRMGGDEFVVLAPGSTAGDALALGERLTAAIAAAGERVVPGSVVAASAGVAVYPDDALDGISLLRRADEALYAAKGARAA